MRDRLSIDVAKFLDRAFELVMICPHKPARARRRPAQLADDPLDHAALGLRLVKVTSRGERQGSGSLVTELDNLFRDGRGTADSWWIARSRRSSPPVTLNGPQKDRHRRSNDNADPPPHPEQPISDESQLGRHAGNAIVFRPKPQSLSSPRADSEAATPRHGSPSAGLGNPQMRVSMHAHTAPLNVNDPLLRTVSQAARGGRPSKMHGDGGVDQGVGTGLAGWPSTSIATRLRCSLVLHLALCARLPPRPAPS